MPSRCPFTLWVAFVTVVLAVPAIAAEHAEPATISLAVAPTTCSPAATTSPDLPATPELMPEPAPLTCTAVQSCQSGCSAFCQGNSVCQVGPTWVKCDGVQTNCPYPNCTDMCGYEDTCCYCTCRAGGGTPIQCIHQCCPF